MNPELQKALIDLAAKLGVTVDHLWGVLLYQARVDAAFDFLICVGCAIYFVVGGRLLRRLHQRVEEDDYGNEEPFWLGFSVYAGIGFFVLIVLLLSAHGFITETTNPEYWALKQILGQD